MRASAQGVTCLRAVEILVALFLVLLELVEERLGVIRLVGLDRVGEGGEILLRGVDLLLVLGDEVRLFVRGLVLGQRGFQILRGVEMLLDAFDELEVFVLLRGIGHLALERAQILVQRGHLFGEGRIVFVGEDVEAEGERGDEGQE